MIDVGEAGDRDAAWRVADPGRSAGSPGGRSACPSRRAPRRPGFAGYKVQLAERARREGISAATINATIPGLTLNSRVIALDRAQPGGVNNPNAYPPFAPYRRQHVNASLISRGQARYRANAARLAAVERRFGVEASVLMSIYGHETSYGSVTGGFDLLPALATLGL